MPEILTVPQIGQLSTILDAAAHGSKVRWLDTDNETIREGIARHVVRGAQPTEWFFLDKDCDVRDAFLRITTTTGWDMAVPIRRLMQLVSEGGFAVDN